MSDEDATMPVDPKELEARILLLELRAREIEAHIRLAQAQAKRKEMRLEKPLKKKRRMQGRNAVERTGQDQEDE